jgi:hypothetical protein
MATSRPAERRWWLGLGVLGGLILGAAIRGLLPPFVLDDAFWRAFWSGPPVAGLFAVVAATIALYPSIRSVSIARENAAREQWWNRAEWALGLATSDRQSDREVANDALVALLDEATETEGKMLFRTIVNLQSGATVDSQPTTAQNGRKRRFFRGNDGKNGN